MKSTWRVLSATIAAGLLFSVPAPAHADVLPPRGSVSIDSVTIDGAGCGWPTRPSVEIKPDGTVLGLTYTGFRAAISPISPAEISMDCEVSVRLRSPQGYTFAIRRLEQGGAADITDGARAQHGTVLYYEGALVLVNHPFQGPYHGVWQRVFDVNGPEYLPCGESQTVTVTDELRVQRGSSPLHKSSSVTLGVDGWPLPVATAGPPPVERISKYFLSWKRCPTS